MKATRLNLIPVVRSALWDAGYSSVKVVNAVNSALGELTNPVVEHTLGDGKVKSKGEHYSVTESIKEAYTAKMTPPLLFDAWHSGVQKLQKIASVDTIGIPPVLVVWLDKFAKGESEALVKEATTQLSWDKAAASV